MIPNEPPVDIPERLVRNVACVVDRIGEAATRAGRIPAEITLVAVTKTVSRAIAWMLPAVGLENAGENRLQSAERKIPGAPEGLRWHMIGHLQRKKARKVVRLFSLIHSIDSAKLLHHVDRVAGEEGIRAAVLLQVNISGEEQKHGVRPEELRSILEGAAEAENTRILGLMGMGPFTADPEECRPLFAGLAQLMAEANRGGWYRAPLRELSMGMTNDFEVAVEEGATLLRVGTALFDGVNLMGDRAHNGEEA